METKKFLGLGAFVVLMSLSACGSSGGGGSNDDASNIYNQCGNDPNCNSNYFTQMYGPNNQGYYQGMQNCGGYQCQVYNVPQVQNCGCNQYGGQQYGQQQYIVAPQGAYLPEQGIYGQGGSFYLGGSFSW